jgi:hypothetical protein
MASRDSAGRQAARDENAQAVVADKVPGLAALRVDSGAALSGGGPTDGERRWSSAPSSLEDGYGVGNNVLDGQQISKSQVSARGAKGAERPSPSRTMSFLEGFSRAAVVRSKTTKVQGASTEVPGSVPGSLKGLPNLMEGVATTKSSILLSLIPDIFKEVAVALARIGEAIQEAAEEQNSREYRCSSPCSFWDEIEPISIYGISYLFITFEDLGGKNNRGWSCVDSQKIEKGYQFLRAKSRTARSEGDDAVIFLGAYDAVYRLGTLLEQYEQEMLEYLMKYHEQELSAVPGKEVSINEVQGASSWQSYLKYLAVRFQQEATARGYFLIFDYSTFEATSYISF